MGVMEFFQEARDAALDGIATGAGRPFGATIVRHGQVVCAVSNTSVRDVDPTAHAELAAVRDACQLLGTLDLSECVMYATSEPCDMCIGAMILASLRTCYYALTAADAVAAGVSGNQIRAYLAGTAPGVLNLINVEQARPLCTVVLAEWQRLHR